MTRPEVSVVMAVKDGAAHLADSVRSILSQDGVSLELVLIDDGSRDATLELMRRFAADDRRVRIIARENRGLVHSLNEGIAAAEGEWIARMDHDDRARPDRLRRTLDFARARGADLCGAAIRTFGETLPRVRRYPDEEAAVKLQLLFNSCFAHPAVVARRGLLLAHPYDPAARHAEDYDLWTRLAAAGARMTNCPDVLLDYRIHAGQVTAAKRGEQDAMRRRIAAAYRARCFPGVDERAHLDVMGRRELLEPARIERASEMLAALAAASGDPQCVVSANAFLFLLRHAELGLPGMLRETARQRIGGLRRVALATLAAFRADQHSAAFGVLERLK